MRARSTGGGSVWSKILDHEMRWSDKRSAPKRFAVENSPESGMPVLEASRIGLPAIEPVVEPRWTRQDLAEYRMLSIEPDRVPGALGDRPVIESLVKELLAGPGEAVDLRLENQ
jgi:hypothetical protein